MAQPLTTALGTLNIIIVSLPVSILLLMIPNPFVEPFLVVSGRQIADIVKNNHLKLVLMKQTQLTQHIVGQLQDADGKTLDGVTP